MVRIRNLLFCLGLLCCLGSLSAQRIRKDHKEMTPSERTVYVNALKAILPDVTTLVNRHAAPSTLGIAHRTQSFFPWHRLFVLDLENSLRVSTGSSLSNRIAIPYWDWRTDFNTTTILWDDQAFLGQFNSPTFTWFGNLGRTMSGDFIIGSPTNTAEINRHLNFPGGTFSDYETFRSGMEDHHGDAHGWVGGAMAEVAISPRDPAFFLHHGFMDKIWQEWEDKSSTVKSVFTVTTMPDYPIDPSTVIDARVHDVWYAYNKKLLLDGLRSTFYTNTINNTKKTYCYVAWNGSAVEGTIYAGDIQRDASDNVIADTKGGFIVDGAGADFYAGSSIELRPGFSTVLGSPFSAQIVDKPCGYTTNNLMGEPDNDPVLYLQTKTDKGLKAGEGKAYPNPFTSELSIDYNVETDTPLSIELVNALGQSVWQQKYGIQRQGLFNTIIPTQDLPKGLYHVLIRNIKNQVTLKVVR